MCYFVFMKEKLPNARKSSSKKLGRIAGLTTFTVGESATMWGTFATSNTDVLAYGSAATIGAALLTKVVATKLSERTPVPPETPPHSAEAFRRDMAKQQLTDEDLAQFSSGQLDPAAEEHRLRQYFEVFPDQK